MDKNAIKDFMERAIVSAAKRENRKVDTIYQVTIIDNYALVVIKSAYIRVERHIVRNLYNNFERTTGLKPVFIDEYMRRYEIPDDDRFGFDLVNCVDPNHSFAYVELFGKPYTITQYRKEFPFACHNIDPPIIHLNKMIDNGFDWEASLKQSFDKFDKSVWDNYREAYYKMYGRRLEEITSHQIVTNFRK